MIISPIGTAKLEEFAVYETRKIEVGGGFFEKRRGWYDRRSGRFLGKNRSEASDMLQITREIIEVK